VVKPIQTIAYFFSAILAPWVQAAAAATAGPARPKPIVAFPAFVFLIFFALTPGHAPHGVGSGPQSRQPDRAGQDTEDGTCHG
jgi:hypothetical protein